MKSTKRISVLLILLLTIGFVAGCGGDTANDEIVIMEGPFAEKSIVAYMAGMLIEENTDLKVTYSDSMDTVPFANAVESGEIDLGLIYDGTLLTTILGYDPSDVPEGEDLYEWANQKGIEDKGIMLIGNLGFENTYALAIKRNFAEENNIKTTTDLKEYSPDLIFGAEHEFFDEEGTMRFNPFNEYYGMHWGDSISMEMSYKYTAIDNGNIDVTMAYTTDGLNVKSDLQLLEDDQDFFPQYYGTLLAKDTIYEEFAETAPNLEEVLTMLNGTLTNETMTQMNYEVDAEGRDAQDVAKDFLIENGLIEG